MTTYLLDANVLIALVVEEHEHHRRASQWTTSVEGFALCPIVEGALMRFLVRIGEQAAVATEVLRALHVDERCVFWPDSISYRSVAVEHLRGHRQVTDAYLVALARANGVRLATFDEALARELPAATVLVPADG